MGGSSNFGGRSEFLADDGLTDPNIKYERRGGCFISTKKVLLCILGSLCMTAVASYLVYRYAPRYSLKEYNSPDDLISNLMVSASNTEYKNTKLNQFLSTSIVPNYYRLRIRTYLDENGPKNFSFEGHVAIVFQVTNSETNTISLNVKNLTIPESRISLSFSTTKKIQSPESSSQLELENVVTTTENEFSAFATNLSTQNEPALINHTNPLKEDQNETTSIRSTLREEHIVYNTAEKLYMNILKTNQDDHNEILTIHLDDYLEMAKNYTLEIPFSGKISNGSTGILRRKYQQANKTSWIVSTLFRPFYARTVFPCFDEPNFKAKFEISIGRRTNMTSVSNMPIKDTIPIEKSSGWVWDHFAVTPVIPTFAVGFVVFNFKPKKIMSGPPVPVFNLWARKTFLNHSDYILESAPRIMEAYNTYFGFVYPAAKIDIVAVPDYPVPALSNWGLLFLKETILLTDTIEEKENLNELLSQELSSQWFGTIVTMQSWNEFWFTEILNSYIRYIGVQYAEPTWNILEKMYFRDQQEVMDIDSTNILPNITTLTSSYNYLENNRLLYKKGSSIIRILNYTLTEPAFREVLHKFIEKWKFKNAWDVDFWNEVGNKSNNNLPEDVTTKDVVDLWINQAGFPLLNAVKNSNNSITITQTRYTDKQIPNNNMWILFIEIIADNMNKQGMWLQNSSLNITLPKMNKNNTCILVKSPYTMLYRTNYDLSNWNALTEIFKTKMNIFSDDVYRAHLIDDAFHLAINGLVPYNVPLNLSNCLINETSLITWEAALKNFHFVNMILEETNSYGDLEKYLLNILTPIYEKLLNDKNDVYNTRKFRKLIITWACKLGYTPCIDWAYTNYLSIINGTHDNKIDKEYRSIIYCIGAEMRGKVIWNHFIRNYIQSDDEPSDVNAVFIGMGCLKDSWIISKYLEEIVKIESTENSVMAWESLSSPNSIHIAIDFFIANWDKIVDKYSYSTYAINRILNAVFSQVVLQSDFDKLMTFFSNEKTKFKHFSRDFAFIINKIKKNIEWKEKYLTTFSNALQEHL